MTFKNIACLSVAVALITSVRATERFVSVDGSDANDGLSRETAFATVQKGVDALAAGDVLTIGPGEYREAVSRENLGDMSIDTVIRAEIPGTALLRGDAPAPEFKPVEGYRHVHKATFDQPVQAVNEVDSLRILETRPSVADVEFNPGSFHYDADARTLYISASDMRSPSDHRYTVSVIESRGGVFLKWPKRVVVEGLAVTGFHSNRALSRMRGGDTFSDIIPWGVYIWLGRDSVVRGAVTYLNAGGVGIISRDFGGNVVENCVSYGNTSQFSVGTANICGKRVNDDAFRGNYAYVGGDHGVRFHGGSTSNNRMERNVSWGHDGNDIQVKGVANYDLSHCVALGSMVGRSQCSLMGKGEGSPSDIVLGGDIDANQEFADPVNLDYRMQSTSRFLFWCFWHSAKHWSSGVSIPTKTRLKPASTIIAIRDSSSARLIDASV